MIEKENMAKSSKYTKRKAQQTNFTKVLKKSSKKLNENFQKKLEKR